jgi:glycosyltransferase involved in cell wall biosynthesis
VKVLYFSRDYTPHDHRFLASLVESGQEVFYLRLERRSRQLEDRPVPPQVTQVPWSGGTGPFAWRRLVPTVLEVRHLLRTLEPDVVHAGPLQSCAFIAALAQAVPLVSMSWGSDILKDAYASRWMKRVTRFTLRRSDVLLGDCAAVRQAAEDFGFPGERVVLFPWGIDLQAFAPAPRAVQAGAADLCPRLGWQDCFVALSLRSWEPVYGVDVVVNAFARAVAEEPRLRLLLLGGGSLAGKIQALLNQRGLHDLVHLGGQVSQNELARYYHAADLYVSASHSDGSSVSLMEALGCGLPALVSDIPGNREWIAGEQAGWLFADGDAGELAAGMLRAARDPAALAGMRLEARALAERRANWPDNFQKLLAAYALAQKIAAGGGE